MLELIAVGIEWATNLWVENINRVKCDCQCTCEIQPVVCPGTSWWWELVKAAIFLGVGIVVGGTKLIGLIIGFISQLVVSRDTPNPDNKLANFPPVESGLPAVESVNHPADQRALAQSQLLAVRKKQALKSQ